MTKTSTNVVPKNKIICLFLVVNQIQIRISPITMMINQQFCPDELKHLNESIGKMAIWMYFILIEND